MAKAKKSKQLSFTMQTRVGLLSEVTAAIAGAKVNINSICAYEDGGEAHFILTTDNNAKAKKALSSLGIESKEEDVILVEMINKVGELQKVAKKIADAGINIIKTYGTAGPGKSSIVVFRTEDDKKTIKIINK